MSALHTFNNTGFKKPVTGPLEGPKRTCGHWPAPHIVVVKGQKEQRCADCWKGEKG